MGVMPERIGKGPILRKLDTRYQDTSSHNRRRQRLTNPTNPSDDIADIGAKPESTGSQPVLSSSGPKNDLDHVKWHWLNKSSGGQPPTPYWPNVKYVAEILKHGFIAALSEADNNKLPIETLWICSGSSDSMSMFIVRNTRQVTLIFDTPTAPSYGGAATVQEDIWVVKRVWPGAPDPVDQPRLTDPNPNKRDVIVVSNTELGNPSDGSIIVRRPVFMP